MDGSKTTPRRVKVEHHIYRTSSGYEIGYRDSSGKQRWKPMGNTTITHVRRERDTILGAKAKGERVQPNPRLTFGDATTRWLKEQVVMLAPNSQSSYSAIARTHLLPRWENRRMDKLTVSDAAKLIRELQAEGKSPHTINKVLSVASRIIKFAKRHMRWAGENIISELDKSERPKLGEGSGMPFTETQLVQTLNAANEPYRTLFELTVETGGREGEILGLTWADIDVESATVTLSYQVQDGKRVALKTEDGWAQLPISRRMVRLLAEHKLRSRYNADTDYVFSTRSGKPISRHDVLKVLRRTMKAAVDNHDRPTFPVMHTGAKLPRGTVPTFHSLRHSAAMDCETPEEAQMLLRHKSLSTTTTVYRRHFSAKRQEALRVRVEARVEATEGSSGQQRATGAPAEVAQLQRVPTAGNV